MRWTIAIGRLNLTTGLLATTVWLNAELASAQAIKADNTLGTVVQTSSPVDFKITGGQASGSNLFHSFQQFSIPTTGSAVFDLSGKSNITSIFNRVTGPNSSNLDGLLRTMNHSNPVNVFLMNPNGIVFGPGALLNIRGSFVATTASAMTFGDGRMFEAMPIGVPLLSVSVPIGLQVGSRAGTIVNQARLRVLPGQSIALVGSGVTVDGGRLTAAGGRIELGSVGVGSLVGLQNGKANYLGVTNFQDLTVTNAARIDTSGEGAGSIQLQGRQVKIEGYSRVQSYTLGNGLNPEAAIVLRASEKIQVKDSDGDQGVQTRVRADIAANAAGNGAKIILEAPLLEILDGAQVRASNYGKGQGGNITIRANQVRAIGESKDVDVSYVSGISNRSEEDATGAAGTTTIEAQSIEIRDGAQIRASTYGGGRGGNLGIKAQTLTVAGRSKGDWLTGITASSKDTATARGGDITIEVDQLQILDGASIRTASEGKGDSGDIKITAQDILLASPETVPYRDWSDISYIGASAEAYDRLTATGNGGNITINTQTLTMRDGTNLLSETYGMGAGGSIRVTADRISADGSYVFETGRPTYPIGNYAGGFLATAYGSGKGGNVTLQVRQLQLTGGSEVLSTTFRNGAAGSIKVTAQSIELAGKVKDPRVPQDAINIRSGFLAASVGAGNAGMIDITTDDLVLRDQAVLSLGGYGLGPAGELTIKADRLKLDTGAMINADVLAGNQGNIDISARLIELRRGSSITTNARSNANGGKIRLNADFIVGLENSDIAANAFNGRGGTIDINAMSVYGLQYRDRLTPENDITASSKAGLNGTVIINSLNIDPTNGLSGLVATLADSSNQVTDRCETQAKSKFIITGRGGIAQNPIDRLRAVNPWNDLRPAGAEPAAIGPVGDLQVTNPANPLVEATALRATTNALGVPELELTALELTASQPRVLRGDVTCAPSATLEPTAIQ